MSDTLLAALTRGATLAITVSFGRRAGRLFDSVMDRLNSDLVADRDDLTREYLLQGQPIMLTQLFILKCLLRDYFSDCQVKHEYHDVAANGHNRAPVMVFIFENIQPLAVEVPRKFPELPSTLIRKEDFMTKQSRSEAASKAHATRRKTALFAKRSATAKKAWLTRRAAVGQAKLT
jgi:hypothetical protein